MSRAAKVYKNGPDELVTASGGTLTVESGGAMDFESGSAMKLAGTAVTASASELNSLAGKTVNLLGVDPVVYSMQDSVSLAELNAGKTLITAVAGRTITILDWVVIPVGGAVAACTAVTMSDTAGSPVLVATIPQADATEDAILRPWTTNIVNGAAGIGAALTAAKGLTIEKTGSAATTVTSLTVRVSYTIADA